MGLWSFLTNSSYRDGYNAGEEFLDLVDDREITQEEANAQWDAVESGHSEDYTRGFADNMTNQGASGFFSWLFGG